MNQLEDILLHEGLTKNETRVLFALTKLLPSNQRPTLKQISELTGLYESHISKTLSNLHRKNIIERIGKVIKFTENCNFFRIENLPKDVNLQKSVNLPETVNLQKTVNFETDLYDYIIQLKTIISNLENQIGRMLAIVSDGNFEKKPIIYYYVIYVFLILIILKLELNKIKIIYEVNYKQQKFQMLSPKGRATEKLEVKKQDKKGDVPNKIEGVFEMKEKDKIPAVKISGMGARVRARIKERHPEKKKSKTDLAAERLMEYWNGLNVRRHKKKTTKVYRESLAMIKSLLTGSFKKREFDTDWLERIGIDLKTLDLDERAVQKTFDEIAVAYRINGNKNIFPKTLSRIIYNPDTKKSVFLYVLAKGVENFEWWKKKLDKQKQKRQVPEVVNKAVKNLETFYTGHLSNENKEKVESGMMQAQMYLETKILGHDENFDSLYGNGSAHFLLRFVDFVTDTTRISFRDQAGIANLFLQRQIFKRYVEHLAQDWPFLYEIVYGKKTRQKTVGHVEMTL